MLKKQPSRRVDVRGNKPEASARPFCGEGGGRGRGRGRGLYLNFRLVLRNSKNQIGTWLFAEEIINFAENFAIVNPEKTGIWLTCRL